MAESIRLTKEEQKVIEKKYLEIAGQQIKVGVKPIRESNLVHIAIEKVIPWLRVDEKGKIYIDSNITIG